MKGLLIKDYKTILHSKNMFLILLVVLLLAMQKHDGYYFLIGYTMMIFTLLVLNTISMDEYYKSFPFLMTMPVKRKTYVTEKYTLMLGFGFLGAALSTALCILLHREMTRPLILAGITTYIILALFQLLMLPIQLKFGGEKGRIVLIGLLACVTVIATSLHKILPGLFGIQGDIGNLIQNMVMGFLSLPAGMIALTTLCAFAVCLILSYCISLRIMRRKEF
ncbi:MAG: ABC-2 transporter permease [Blautia sp.]|nr:ABC-2 transporter permease [Blautia sp.]MCM1199873.1 ABC-2 transporter permease [Bacteroides fragilis]